METLLGGAFGPVTLGKRLQKSYRNEAYACSLQAKQVTAYHLIHDIMRVIYIYVYIQPTSSMDIYIYIYTQVQLNVQSSHDCRGLQAEKHSSDPVMCQRMPMFVKDCSPASLDRNDLCRTAPRSWWPQKCSMTLQRLCRSR